MVLAAVRDVAHSLDETEVVAYVLVDLALILAAARAVGWIFVRMNQPRVIGEIIAGIIIGPTVLGGSIAVDPEHAGTGIVNKLFPLQAFEFLNLLATLGLLLFMFLVGLEVKQKFFRGHATQIVGLGLAVTIVPFVVGFGIAYVLDEPGVWRVRVTPRGEHVSFTTHALFVGAALAVTAFPVLARILQEKGLLATQMGAVSIGAAALSLPLMFVMIASAFASGPRGVPSSVSVKLLLALALAAFLFLVVRPLLRMLVDRRYRPGEPLSPDLFALLLIGVFATGAAADRIGVQALTGGFLFGACVPQVPGLAEAMIDRLHELVVIVLIPVLLAVAGLEADLRAFQLDDVPGILLFLAAMIASKWGTTILVGPVVRMSLREANAVGVLMNCRGLEILIVGLIGKQAGVLTSGMLIVFVIGAIVTTLMTGPLFDRFAPKEPQARLPYDELERERELAEVDPAVDT